MLRLVSDEDVHDDIIRGLRRREPTLDIVRVVDAGLPRTPDPVILEWAASQERVLLSGDLNTMIGFAWSRVRSALPMPGDLALLENIGVGPVIDDIFIGRGVLRSGRDRQSGNFHPLLAIRGEGRFSGTVKFARRL